MQRELRREKRFRYRGVTATAHKISAQQLRSVDGDHSGLLFSVCSSPALAPSTILH